MRPSVPLILAAMVGIAAGITVALSGPDSPGEGTASAEADLAPLQAKMRNTVVLPEDFRRVPDFTLQAGDGAALEQDFLDDRWTLAFFGYTHCPDVCPITLQVMKNVVADLQAQDVEPMQVAFFTVDPVRDTAERMKEYVGFFDEDFVGVTGELNDVQALTRSLGIVSAFTAVEGKPDEYLVDHTASMLLIDPQRRVRAKFNAPHEADTIVQDFVTLREALG